MAVDQTRRLSREEWRKIAEEITDKAFYLLKKRCYEQSHDPLLCFMRYEPPVELINIADRLKCSYSWMCSNLEEPIITKREVELLWEMPYKDIYKEYNEILHERIGKEVARLRKIYCADLREDLEEALKKLEEEKDQPRILREATEEWIEAIKKEMEEYRCE